MILLTEEADFLGGGEEKGRDRRANLRPHQADGPDVLQVWRDVTQVATVARGAEPERFCQVIVQRESPRPSGSVSVSSELAHVSRAKAINFAIIGHRNQNLIWSLRANSHWLQPATS